MSLCVKKDAMMLRSAEADPHVTELTRQHRPKSTLLNAPNHFSFTVTEATMLSKRSSHQTDRHGLHWPFLNSKWVPESLHPGVSRRRSDKTFQKRVIRRRSDE
jgi:hypothetical protein